MTERSPGLRACPSGSRSHPSPTGPKCLGKIPVGQMREHSQEALKTPGGGQTLSPGLTPHLEAE